MKHKKNFVRDNVPLSRFGVLVAQLESIVASAAQQSPDPSLCFDLLSDLIIAIEEEPKESILLWQRKCEDALFSLLTLGARRPVRHLAAVAMVNIISKGDSISIYSRTSSLQGFLSDGKKSEPQKVAGVAQCLGELYRQFGRKLTSGLLETTTIAAKLMKFNEEFVREEAMLLLQNAVEGCGGGGAANSYLEAFRLVTRFAVGDKSFAVRITSARCLKAFSDVGWPGLGFGDLESSAILSVKALEDPNSSVSHAFADSLGSLLALGMNPAAQIVQPRGKVPFSPAKKLDGGLTRFLSLPFTKATGARARDLRFGITLSWVYFIQAIRSKYQLSDIELQNYALDVLNMLNTDVDSHSLACVLYILRVGVIDQMTEPTQRDFLVFLGKELAAPHLNNSIKIAVLRTLSYVLKLVGEVPEEFRKICDDSVTAAVSHPFKLIRFEAAMTLQALAEVDPTCVGGLVSCGVATVNALREVVSFDKGICMDSELDNLHGQSVVLAAMVHVSPKLTLGYPARFPKLVFDVSKKLLEVSFRNPMSAAVCKEAGWLLLTSLFSSIPIQELEDQVFDILALWAKLFGPNSEADINRLRARIQEFSAAIEALEAFIRCFISVGSDNSIVLLQPVLVFLSSALEYVLLLQRNQTTDVKQELDLFTVRVLRAYYCIPDPFAYKSDHHKIIQLCSIPFRDPNACEESSSLMSILDKRDAWLGPWTPGRDSLEDELKAFQGGKNNFLPCLRHSESLFFPQPDTISKMLVNQMLMCYGILFSAQDNGDMLKLLGTIDQSLKSGKRHVWHRANVTNICAGLLFTLKAMISFRVQHVSTEVLNFAMAIFLNILAEGDISPCHLRAASEGLGLLARLGDDSFTVGMVRSLLNELNVITDSSYSGSMAFALGCVHRCAGGIALSTLVPSTVNEVSSLAKSLGSFVQLRSLHGLLLTIEAAGLSYVTHVQTTLGLAMDVLFYGDNGLRDVEQAIGRLVNALVAVVGPELAPGSIFFSRCKSVIAEISSRHDTGNLLERVRFTQQLVLFAPQAVSVNSHVRTLLATLSSRQPTLRKIAIGTLRHLVEKNPELMTNEQIEATLFYTLDDETDSLNVNLLRETIMRLLNASTSSTVAHWIWTCKTMLLATTSGRHQENVGIKDGETNNSSLDLVEDDENMVSGSKDDVPAKFMHEGFPREKHLRYRTRVFAAECLSLLPSAVRPNPTHFDISLPMKTRVSDQKDSDDGLVLHLQELISLAYQLSTIQFENMRPIGVRLLATIVDKFEKSLDPDLSGHLLLEQYLAQFVSALRTALDPNSGPVLLEAGLELATKIMTSGLLGNDQAAMKRIFSLISRLLNDLKEIYYPSYAEWVSCKIKIRLLAALASLKCYTYVLLQNHSNDSNECLSLLPTFAKLSSIIGKYWIGVLKDYCYLCLPLSNKNMWKPFLEGIHLPPTLLKVKSIFQETWPVLVQALALDAVPAVASEKLDIERSQDKGLISGYSMVDLDLEDFQFLWGFSFLAVFQNHHPCIGSPIVLFSISKDQNGSPTTEANHPHLKLYEIILPVFQCLLGKRFFDAGYVKLNVCQELLEVLSCTTNTDDSWNTLAISVFLQLIRQCPDEFFASENFNSLALELPLSYAINSFDRKDDSLISQSFNALKAVVSRLVTKPPMLPTVLALMSLGYNGIRISTSESSFASCLEFIRGVHHLLIKCDVDMDSILKPCVSSTTYLAKDCLQFIPVLEHQTPESTKLILEKLQFSLEETIALCQFSHVSKSSTQFPLYINCTNTFSSVFSHFSPNAQSVALRVIKTLLQKSSDNTFNVFLAAELLPQVFTLIETAVGKRHVAVVKECLAIIVLVQTHVKSSDSQKTVMRLLLRTLIVISEAVQNDFNKEAGEVKAIAVSVVSGVAQNPSSAGDFKEALVTISAAHKQVLQELVIASVTRGSAPQPLPIRLPAVDVPVVGNDENSNDDEDWDSFQSFPNADNHASLSVDDQNGSVATLPEE